MQRRHSCAGCFKPLKKRFSRKYCSNKCQGDHRQRRVVEDWLAGGKAVKGAMMVMKKAVRKHLIDKAGGCCEACGWNGKHPADGRSLLHIHHKDGDASNSSPSNLSVLCPNCHSMTENFGTRNRGSKRYKRFFVRVRPRDKAPKGRRKTQRKS